MLHFFFFFFTERLMHEENFIGKYEVSMIRLELYSM